MDVYTLAVRHNSDAPDELGAVSVYATFEDAALIVREIAREESMTDDRWEDGDPPAERDLGEVFEYLYRAGIYAEILQHEVAQ